MSRPETLCFCYIKLWNNIFPSNILCDCVFADFPFRMAKGVWSRICVSGRSQSDFFLSLFSLTFLLSFLLAKRNLQNIRHILFLHKRPRSSSCEDHKGPLPVSNKYWTPSPSLPGFLRLWSIREMPISIKIKDRCVKKWTVYCKHMFLYLPTKVLDNLIHHCLWSVDDLTVASERGGDVLWYIQTWQMMRPRSLKIEPEHRDVAFRSWTRHEMDKSLNSSSRPTDQSRPSVEAKSPASWPQWTTLSAGTNIAHLYVCRLNSKNKNQKFKKKGLEWCTFCCIM